MTIAGDLRSRKTPSTPGTTTVVPGLGWPEASQQWSPAGLGWPDASDVSRGTEQSTAAGTAPDPGTHAGGATAPTASTEPTPHADAPLTATSTAPAGNSAESAASPDGGQLDGAALPKESSRPAVDGQGARTPSTGVPTQEDAASGGTDAAAPQSPQSPGSTRVEDAVSRGTTESAAETTTTTLPMPATSTGTTAQDSEAPTDDAAGPDADQAPTTEMPTAPGGSAAASSEDPEAAVSRGTGSWDDGSVPPSTATPSTAASSTPVPSAPSGDTVREVLEADISDTPTVAAASGPRTSAFRTAGDIAAMGVGSDESTPLARSAEHALLVREGRRLGDPLPRPSRTRVMVVANQKGGVGKTTSTVNMAAALAQHGLRVLVIDLDPQGNASTALAIDHHRGTPSTYDALVEGRPLAEVVQPSPEIDGLFVVPATIDLAGAEIELVSMVAREGRLRRAIHAHPQVFGTGEDRIDYVLIDCPPSLGLLTLNALVAGDEMLIPIQAEYYALEGLGQLLETVEMVKAHLNPTLTVSTIVLTMYDARTRLSAGVAEEVRTHFQGQVLRTAIPRSVRISEAPSYGQTVMTYDPGSPGALSYLEAAREMALRADLDTTVDEGARA